MKSLMQKPGLWTAIVMLLAFASCTRERKIETEGFLVPETVEHNSSIPAVAINGTILHTEAYGHPDSALIIVLHGGPGSDYRYLLNCAEFANQGYRVVFYDQRGSGLSKRHNKETYSLQLMLDDLGAVITHYRQNISQKVFLLGHSWGAMLATAYINKYPAAISGALLAEPGGFVWQDVVDYVKRSTDIRITSELINDMAYQYQFITGTVKQHAVMDYKYALLSVADGHKDNPTGNEGPLPFWRSGAIVNQALFEIGDREKPDWTTNLNQFTTKILFVYSGRNRAYGLPHAQKVSAAYPNVQLLKINNAGHDMLSFPAGWAQCYPEALTYFNSLK